MSTTNVEFLGNSTSGGNSTGAENVDFGGIARKFGGLLMMTVRRNLTHEKSKIKTPNPRPETRNPKSET